ncbi:hypothetical protein CL1_0524 [Thermococcus cleftensis]|uniref:Uncharacterized protein n=1 Tax=Thermococcus cleftensis (strain DSM 27260 / KACC 17922 / CL1) TaxID=163003 RepID=I3ZSP8_THECF|nr:hypothetical protein [Thermococcus cleftensis]AFL94732.1 hypothetical protein CL1_0524 [Thermococcus cleftensis]
MGATRSEIVIEVPRGTSISEIRKMVREIVLRYLREKGVSEEELKKVRVRVEVLEK